MSEGATTGTNQTDPYAVLRLRDFRLYLTGRLVSVLGQQMITVAVGWELYQRTHSALALGLVGLVEMIAMLCCTLPAGHFADNINRKRIIMTALLVSSSASLGLGLISWVQGPVPCIYACLFTAAAARTFLWPASAAFLTSLVPRELFARAVTWNSGTFQLSSVAGPAVGGGVIALLHRYSGHPAAYIYLFNFCAALVCFFCVRAVSVHHVVKNPQPISLKSVATGFQFIFSQRLILGMITLDMFAVFLGGATALLPVFATEKDLLNAGPGGLGLLQAAMPVGSVLCAIYLAHRSPLQKAGRALLWCVVVFGLATIVFGFSRWFWFSFAMMFLCGAVDNVSVVVRQTSVQLLTPDDKRGRVSAVNSLFIGTSNELGGFESGFVAYIFGPWMGHTTSTGAVVSVVSGGIGTILVVIMIAYFWPEIRRYGKLA